MRHPTGSLGAVVVLLLWLWLSSFIVLLGAELDAEIEHQTARDTTVGEAEPMGSGAHTGTTPPTPGTSWPRAASA